jgi:hypothetical protein
MQISVGISQPTFIAPIDHRNRATAQFVTGGLCAILSAHFLPLKLSTYQKKEGCFAFLGRAAILLFRRPPGRRLPVALLEGYLQTFRAQLQELIMPFENSGLAGRTSLVLAMVLMELLCGFRAAAQSGAGPRGAAYIAEKSFRIPLGTVLPLRINRGFSSKNARAGKVITGRIMQDVPLPDGGKIPEGSRIVGTIVSAVPARTNSSGRVSFRFDELEIHHRRIAVVTNLRALASFMEVELAQVPETSPGFGTPYPWATTRQIGGDEVYGVGGAVTDQWGHTVGKGVFGGALVHVRAQPGTNCRGALDDDRLQALWVISSDACGVYGMIGVKIVHAGRTEPAGEIVPAAESGDLRVGGGSGMLLRVVR